MSRREAYQFVRGGGSRRFDLVVGGRYRKGKTNGVGTKEKRDRSEVDLLRGEKGKEENWAVGRVL